jgi:transposase
MQLQGVGCTTASAIVSTIGDARDFKNGRQLAAWLGLVPGQYSSGGKTRLGRITKAGDGYLRTLLVLGAKSVLAAARNKHDRLSRWAMALEVRCGYWKAVIAIAAKHVDLVLHFAATLTVDATSWVAPRVMPRWSGACGRVRR